MRPVVPSFIKAPRCPVGTWCICRYSTPRRALCVVEILIYAITGALRVSEQVCVSVNESVLSGSALMSELVRGRVLLSFTAQSEIDTY